MSDDAAPSSPKPRRRALLLTGAVVAPFLAICLVAFLIWRDEPPPDVSDLAVKTLVLSDEENAFQVILRAVLRVGTPPTPWKDEEELFRAMSRGESWDDAKATAWLAPYAQLWPELERAATLPQSQGPTPASAVAAGTYDIATELLPLRWLMNLRVWHLQKSGNTDAAVAALVTSLRVSHRIRESHSVLIVWLVGESFTGATREQIERLALAHSLSAENAAQLIAALEENRPSAPAFAEVLRHEYAFFNAGLAQVMAAKPHGTPVVHPELESIAQHFRFAIKPNRTLRLQAGHTRALIAHLESDWRTFEARVPEPTALLDGWRRYASSNFGGETLIANVTTTLRDMIHARVKLQSAISRTQAAIAARRHETETGQLPENLVALVPRYFSQVPRDFFDDASIRYSREFRAVWSVGSEGHVVKSADAGDDPAGLVLRFPVKAAETRRE